MKELGLKVEQQFPMPFINKGIQQEVGYGIDLMIENKVIIGINQLKVLHQFIIRNS